MLNFTRNVFVFRRFIAKNRVFFLSGFRSAGQIDIYCTKMRKIVVFSAKTIAFIKKMLYDYSEGFGVIRSVNDVISLFYDRLTPFS